MSLVSANHNQQTKPPYSAPGPSYCVEVHVCASGVRRDGLDKILSTFFLSQSRQLWQRNCGPFCIRLEQLPIIPSSSCSITQLYTTDRDALNGWTTSDLASYPKGKEWYRMENSLIDTLNTHRDADRDTSPGVWLGTPAPNPLKFDQKNKPLINQSFHTLGQKLTGPLIRRGTLSTLPNLCSKTHKVRFYCFEPSTPRYLLEFKTENSIYCLSSGRDILINWPSRCNFPFPCQHPKQL